MRINVRDEIDKIKNRLNKLKLLAEDESQDNEEQDKVKNVNK
jgi:hypothetical protein